MLNTPILLFLIVISGWFIQRGSFCLVAAVDSIIEKKLTKILMIFGVALFSGAILMFFQIPIVYSPSRNDFLLALLGAVVFGFGATLNSGCFFGTLTKLSKGNIHMLFSLAGIISTSILAPPLVLEKKLNVSYPSFYYYFILLLIVTILIFFQKHDKKYNYFMNLIIPGLVFGIMNSSTFGWSLSQLIINIWFFFNNNILFVKMQVLEFFAFLLGMWIYHLKYNQFKWKKLDSLKATKHFFAGIIMALGARMMGGGNDNLLFQKLPSITFEVFMLMYVLVLSIYITQTVLLPKVS